MQDVEMDRIRSVFASESGTRERAMSRGELDVLCNDGRNQTTECHTGIFTIVSLRLSLVTG